MPWLRSDTSDFAAIAQAAPGWYWVMRPRQVGPRAYDARDGVLCLVLVQANGSLLSPLADLRELSQHDLSCLDDDSGARFPTWFSGPVSPGPERRFPRSAACEGCETLVRHLYGLFSTYGFGENKHDPARVRTRDLGEPKPNATRCSLVRIRTRDLSVGNCGQNS